MAGGYARMASPSRISLQRADKSGPLVFRLDAEAMARRKDVKPFPIQPDDVITVPERLF